MERKSAGGRPTVYDIAEAANVSTATVSFSFHHPDRVRPETRERVLNVARSIGYLPSASARSLVHGRTNALGLYSFDLILDAKGETAEGGTTKDAVLSEEPDVLLYPLYVDEVQRGFELECSSNGQALVLDSVASQDAGRMADFAGRVDGLAVFPGRTEDEILERVARRVPVVLLSRPMQSGMPFYYIQVDNDSGMRSLISHLVDVHGLTDIQFVGSLVDETTDFQFRFESFQASLRARGLSVPAKPLNQTVLFGEESFANLKRTRRPGQPPQALVCVNDQLALYILDEFTKHGVRVPEDVILTGFDGILAGRLSKPTLTTVRQPMEAMGRHAASVLYGSAGKPWDESDSATFPVQLVPRQSCGC